MHALPSTTYSADELLQDTGRFRITVDELTLLKFKNNKTAFTLAYCVHIRSLDKALAS